MEPLYLDSKLSFEKLGAEVSLPEDAAQWPQEIMQELFKQVPYVADFHPDVNMETVNAEQGYGFGHFEVQNKTEAPTGATPEQESAVGIRHVRIPIIVKDFKLQPFDVLITEDSHMLPLTEARIRQALFRPQAFDVTSKTPGDQSMVGQLYPPYRQNYGFGGGGMSVGADMGKTSSDKTAGEQPTEKDFSKRLQSALGLSDEDAAKISNGSTTAPVPVKSLGAKTAAAGDNLKKDPGDIGPKVKDVIGGQGTAFKKMGSLLGAISDTVRPGDYTKVAEALSSPDLVALYVEHGAYTAPALAKIASFETTLNRTAQYLPAFRPDVMQLVRGEDGYVLKTACSSAWAPVERSLGRGDALKLLGEKIVLAADVSGSTTVSEGPAATAEEEGDSPADVKAKVVSDFGLYKVQGADGRELVGFVIPNLLDIDGTAVPLALFTNGSESAMQSEIVGEPAGAGANLPKGQPQGKGIFYRTLSNGQVEATVPMTVKGGVGTDQYSVETFDGKGATVALQAGAKKPFFVDQTLVLPDSFVFSPMGQSKNVELIDKPELFHKQGSAMKKMASVTVRAGNDSFSFEGLPLQKLASEQKHFLNQDDAMLLLAGLGVDLKYGAVKLAESMAFQRPVDIRIGRMITAMGDSVQESYKTASELVEAIPMLRKDLLKEAAFIPDPTAVDTVLSLGFINPENIQTFVKYLPQIEGVQSKLCELLIGVRLGMPDIPIGAIEKTIKSLEDVIEGLKILAFQKN